MKIFEIMFVISNNSVQLHSNSDFCAIKISTEYFGKKSIQYLGPTIWNSLPHEMKSIVTLFDFTVH